MLQIVRVDIVDGQTLDIELNNGHIILFDTQRLFREDHTYDSLHDLEVLPRPGTDGQTIFWPGGLCLTLEEIIKRLLHNNEVEGSH